ncbi:MAG: diguanylate cyclase [Candidatus Cloacimonadota bacterium]|nr:diguanylate cyclase [Candidatus Cloacimonadota bacterium]
MNFKMTKFDELLQQLLVSKNFESSLSLIIRDIQLEFSFQSCGIFIKNKKNLYRLVISRNVSHHYSKKTAFSEDDKIVKSMKYLKLLERVEEDSFKFEHDYSHLLLSPLHFSNQLLGFMFIDKNENQFSDSDIIKFDMFSSLTSLILHIFEQDYEINHNIEIDKITRLLTAPAFYTHLQSYVSRTVRYGTYLSYVTLKINHYKELYRTFGKEEVQKCFEKISNLLKDSLRANEISTQKYPDTFAFILLENHPRNNPTVITRLQNEILGFSKIINKNNLCWGISMIDNETVEIDSLIHISESNALKATKEKESNVVI